MKTIYPAGLMALVSLSAQAEYLVFKEPTDQLQILLGARHHHLQLPALFLDLGGAVGAGQGLPAAQTEGSV